MSPQTEMVLAVLTADAPHGKHGYEISKATGLPGGTVYPLLARLERTGLVVSRQEEPEHGRRRRTYYRLTAKGWAAAVEARVELARLQQFGRALS